LDYILVKNEMLVKTKKLWPKKTRNFGQQNNKRNFGQWKENLVKKRNFGHKINEILFENNKKKFGQMKENLVKRRNVGQKIKEKNKRNFVKNHLSQSNWLKSSSFCPKIFWPNKY